MSEANDRNWEAVRQWLDARDKDIRGLTARVQKLEADNSQLKIKVAQFQTLAVSGRGSGSTS